MIVLDSLGPSGIVVWLMVEVVEDDAMATAARRFRDALSVEQIIICQPEKDLMQLVSGTKFICWDRRRNIVIDEISVFERSGVPPKRIRIG